MSPRLKIEVEIFPGTSIESAATEMTNLANRLNIVAMADFNGVKLMACPGDNPLSLVNEYNLALKSDKPYKLARAKSKAPDLKSCGE